MNSEALYSDKNFTSEIYKTVDAKKLKLLIRQPDDNSGKPHTPMLWIHGGGFGSGTPDDFIGQMAYFAKLGYTCFAVEYRLADDNPNHFDRLIEDCQSAVAFIRGNAKSFGIIPDKLVALGESAGGYLSATLGTPNMLNNKTDIPNFVVNINPVLTMFWKFQDRLISENESKLTVTQWIDNFEKRRAHSPLEMANQDNVPCLIVNGICDTVTEPEFAMMYFQKLKNLSVDVDIILKEDTNHAFSIFNYHSPYESVVEFLDELASYLKNKGILPE